VSERVKHVEMYDGRTFCSALTGEHVAYDYAGVNQRTWHDDVTSLVGSDCEDCLSQIYTLAMWAENGLYAMRKAGKLRQIGGASWNPPIPSRP